MMEADEIEIDSDAIQAAFGKLMNVAAPVASVKKERKQREKAVRTAVDKAVLRKRKERTEQVNLKVTKATKAKFQAFIEKLGMTQADWFEDFVAKLGE